MDSEGLDAEDTAHCVVCEKQADVVNLYYCLCHAAVCDDCINNVKINEDNWKCPKCGELMHIESTKLFRQH